MKENELLELAEKIAVLMEQYQRGTDKVTDNFVQSSQLLQQSAQNVTGVAQRAANDAAHQVKQSASEALNQGLAAPLKDCDARLDKSASKIEFAAQKIEQQSILAQKMFSVFAWKSFVASAAGSLAVIAVAIYMANSARVQIKQSEWIGSINTAVEAGKIIACPDGGICANINGKLTRLDK